MTTSFLVPSFNKSALGKIHKSIDVISEHVLMKSSTSKRAPAIASEGFTSNRDGTYVLATRFDHLGGNATATIGFTSTRALDSDSVTPHQGYHDFRMNGSGLHLNGQFCGGSVIFSDYSMHYLPSNITKRAKEIVAVFTVSKNKKEVQFIVDGIEGSVQGIRKIDLPKKDGSEIFPVVTLAKCKVEFIPFNQVKSRSPKIDQLMKKFLKNEQEPIAESEKKTQIKKAVKTLTVSKKVSKNKSPTNKKKIAKKVTKKAGKKIAKK